MPRSGDTADGLPARPSVRRGRRPVRRRALHDRRGRLQGTPRRARAEALRSRLTKTTPADRSWQGLGRWNHPTGEIPMPKFVIERQYLLPIYQRLIIDAPDITNACQEAIEDDAAREIPEGLIEQIERGNIHSGSFLWEDQPEY